MLQNVSSKVNLTDVSQSEDREEMAASMENVPLMISYMLLSLTRWRRRKFAGDCISAEKP